MQNHFEILKQTRENVIKLIDQFTADQLNEIPEGFSNNLIWNAGHILVTQQLLCYRLSNFECLIEEKLLELFCKGTKPEGDISQGDINYIKDQMRVTIGKLEADFMSGKFTGYNNYPTSYGITLKTIEEAIIFNNVHEGLHFGYMLALKNKITA